MDYSQMIRVLVDDEEKEYSVPETLLVEKSDFFKAACTKPWKEAEERTVRLRETDITTFDHYLHWIYRGVVFTPRPGTGCRRSVW